MKIKKIVGTALVNKVYTYKHGFHAIQLAPYIVTHNHPYMLV